VGEAVDHLCLGDDIEIAALGEQEARAAEWFEVPGLLARHFADALRHRTNLAPIAREDRQDTVSLPEVVTAQHDPFRAIGSLSGGTRHNGAPFVPPIIADRDAENERRRILTWSRDVTIDRGMAGHGDGSRSADRE